MTLFWYSEYLQAAWMLLAELAPAVQKFSHQFILDYWERHASSTEGEAPSGVSHACTVSVCMDGWKIEKWKTKSFNMDKSLHAFWNTSIFYLLSINVVHVLFCNCLNYEISVHILYCLTKNFKAK